MYIAFGLPFLGLNPQQATPPVTPPAIQRIVPARSLPPNNIVGGQSSALPRLTSVDLKKLSETSLPKSLLNFPTQSNIRSDLNPLGAVTPRNEREQWLNTQLDSIFQANKKLFGSLKPTDIRLTYDAGYDRLATVDLEGLEITFGPRAFALTQDDEALTAILCHELSHVLLGHQSFSTPLPNWVQSDPLVASARVKQETLRKGIDIFSVASRYEALAVAERSIRADMGSAGVADQTRKATSEEILAFAKQSGTDYALGQRYLTLREVEAEYQTKIAAWQAAIADEKIAADVVMGEPGASANWTEEQADLLGFRLFLARGGQPEDFINALVRTLSPKDPGLVDYVDQLFEAKDIHQIEAPERSFAGHPTGRWRVYNLLVRELHLRYPEQYRKLMPFVLPPANAKRADLN